MVVGKIRSNILTQYRAVLGDVNIIAAYAQDMSEFLNESELSERRAFIETFFKEIVVMPGDALMRYTIPISQSIPKIAVLLGRRSGEFRVDNAVEACSQSILVGGGAIRPASLPCSVTRRHASS